MEIRSNSSVAIKAGVLQYGSAEAIAAPSVAFPTPQASGHFKFFVGELSGIMFIAVSTVFVYVVPASLAKRGALKAAMDRLIKRTLDIVGASVGLILSAPLMLAVAIAVRLSSAGPVFYTQTRVGVNRRRNDRRYAQHVGASDRRGRDRRRDDYFGRPFEIIKFRTMVVDAEKATGPVWATKQDPRITSIGRILRKARLDEIPQFWSVLKGDMSLVGPRPERPTFVRHLCQEVEGYERRLEVKPGLTGLAQVENGYDSSVASVAEKVRFDLTYIRGWSIWSDVRILARTVVVVLTGKGAC